MNHLTFDAFLDLAWSDNVRHVLRVKADRDDLLALTASRTGDKLTAQAWTKWPPQWPSDVVAIWCKRPLPDTDVAKSKTMQAVDLVLDQGLTVYAAAKQIGINQSAVHRALARREGKETCPCCGQVLREGFSIDPSVLKSPSRGPASA